MVVRSVQYFNWYKITELFEWLTQLQYDSRQSDGSWLAAVGLSSADVVIVARQAIRCNIYDLPLHKGHSMSIIAE